MRNRRVLVIPLITLVIMAALSAMAPSAFADGGDFSIDFIAAGPFTYDHDTGVGGAYEDRTISKTDGVVESLEGGDFECGDLVVYFAAITVDAGATGEQDIELDVGFLAEPTGQPGVGHSDLVSASPNTGDSGMAGDTGDTTASIVPGTEEIDTSGSNDELVATVAINNLDPGEVFILRLVTELDCIFDSDPTGNLQAEIHGGRVVDPVEDVISVGNQTVPFQSLSAISQPASVSVSVGACPAPGSPTRPVTVEIDPPGTATVTITGPGGPYVVTGDGDTLDLEPGTYEWNAEANEGFILQGTTSGQITVGSCPRIPASVSVEVGACPAPGSATRPVTVTIDGPVTVTINGPGGAEYVVSETDTIDLPVGEYTWTAETDDEHQLDVDSGHFTVEACPAIEASVLVTVGACPSTSSETKPVTITIGPEGGADVTITGPNGFNQVVTGTGSTLDLAEGDYTWSAVANEAFEIIGASEGSFTVGSCIVQVLPRTELPKTGANLPGIATAGMAFVLLGIGMVTVSRRREPLLAGVTNRTATLERLRGRTAWTTRWAYRTALPIARSIERRDPVRAIARYLNRDRAGP